MNTSSIYPELRRNLDRYTVREVTARLPQLMAYGEPIVVTHTRCGPWVLVPSGTYDTLIAVWAGFNAEMERRRQAVEPLPSLST